MSEQDLKRQAIQYYRAGNLEAAAGICMQLLELQSDSPEALMLLGVIRLLQGKSQEAVEYLSRSARLRPRDPAIHFNLAAAYTGTGDRNKAIACYQKSINIKPDNTEAYLNCAQLQAVENRLDDACRTQSSAVQLEPGNATLRVGLAKLHSRAGRYEEAMQALDPVIGSKLKNFDDIFVYVNLSKRLKREKEAIQLLMSALGDGGHKKDKMVAMQFGLGNLLDSLERYDEAFLHFSEANNLHGNKFNIEDFRGWIDGLAKVYTRDLLKSLPHADTGSTRPVIIVGMPRSGTSLIEQILDCHSMVAGGGELEYIYKAAMGLQARMQQAGAEYGTSRPDIPRYPECISIIRQDMLDGIAGEYLAVLDSISVDARYVTDKMPGNFMHLGLIELLFPNARIIHCKRDSLDVCLSCYIHSFGHEVYEFTHGLKSLGQFYNGYTRMMEHWRDHLSLEVFDLQYESLVQDPENTLKPLLGFLGLDWEEQCLAFHSSERLVNTISYDQVKQPLYTTSIRRWKHYDKYLDELVKTIEEGW